MNISYEKSFLKTAKSLPKKIQIKLAIQIDLLQQNPFHPLLHSKQLSGDLTGLLSFRITREWRVIFYFMDPENIRLVKVAHRKDIYR